MAHPYQEHRAHKVERSRAHKIAGGRLHRASGGRIAVDAEEDSERKSDRQIARDPEHKGSTAKATLKAGGHVEGRKSRHRLDRKHHRARGGRTHGDEREDRALVRGMVDKGCLKRARGGRTKGKTTVNVNVMPQGGIGHPGPGLGPMAGPPPGLAPAAPPPVPPPRPPMMPPPGVGAGPPGMMPPPVRKRGGRVNQGPGDKMPKQPPGWSEGEKNKTPVQHTDGKADGKDIGRNRPITYASGGRIGDGAQMAAKPLPSPRPGAGIADGPQKPRKMGRGLIHAGSRSGEGRLEKIRLQAGR